MISTCSGSVFLVFFGPQVGNDAVKFFMLFCKKVSLV